MTPLGEAHHVRHSSCSPYSLGAPARRWAQVRRTTHLLNVKAATASPAMNNNQIKALVEHCAGAQS